MNKDNAKQLQEIDRPYEPKKSRKQRRKELRANKKARKHNQHGTSN